MTDSQYLCYHVQLCPLLKLTLGLNAELPSNMFPSLHPKLFYHTLLDLFIPVPAREAIRPNDKGVPPIRIRVWTVVIQPQLFPLELMSNVLFLLEDDKWHLEMGVSITRMYSILVLPLY